MIILSLNFFGFILMYLAVLKQTIKCVVVFLAMDVMEIIILLKVIRKM